MQEMHGKECEGRFLGVKLDEYSAPGARQDRRDVDIEQDTASGSGRPERPDRRSGSHKGRQVTLPCTSPSVAAACMQPRSNWNKQQTREQQQQ